MARRLHPSVYKGINKAMTPEFGRWAKKTYGISGKKLLAKVAAVEGGGTAKNPNVSYAGARGPFQFIPSTRNAYLKKYGVDAWKTNTSAAKAAMIHLKGTGVRGYNPGLPAYEGMVLGADVDTRPLRTGRSLRGAMREAGGLKVTRPSASRGQVQPGGSGLAGVIQALEDRPPQVSSMGVAPPAFSAQARLPKGFQPVASGGGPVRDDAQLDTLLGAIRGLQNEGIEKTTVTPGSVSGGAQRAAGGVSGGAGGRVVRGMAGYPLARRGKTIGTPHAGTHTLGNWQSDRALDIAVPVGTPVLATSNGRIEKTGGSAGSAGRFAGFNLTLRGRKGDGYFYTHLSKLRVRPGQRVRKGQVIGYSGAANGVAHLHIGRERGDPRVWA